MASYGNNRVLRYDGRSGFFMDLFATSGDLRYPTQLLFISEPEPPPELQMGDCNESGYVDDDDLSLLLAHWNAAGVDWIDGDLNGSNYVDDDDLSLLLANWHHGTPPPGALPEPASATLLLLGFSGLLWRRMKR